MFCGDILISEIVVQIISLQNVFVLYFESPACQMFWDNEETDRKHSSAKLITHLCQGFLLD